MFNAPSIGDHYRRVQEDVRGDILRESEEQIMGTDTQELARYYLSRYAFSPIEENPDEEANYDVQNYVQDVPNHMREDIYRGEGDLRNMLSQRVVVEVPILPNKDRAAIARLRGESFSLSYSPDELRWGETAITATIETKGYQFEKNAQQIGQEVNGIIGRIRQELRWKNEAIEKNNRELHAHIVNQIEGRKQKISESKEKLAALTQTVNIPLKKKPSAAAQAIRVEHKPLIQRVKPKPTLPEEYVVDEARVNDIVALLDNQARTYEKSPKAVKDLGEEDLRDLLLANLNSVFEGAATGETFSKKGKTDIHLNIAKGDILIAECKIWSGKTLYGKTIDQLRGYLTWRQNYGIMITFVRIKEFTKVLRESEATIQAHDSYLNGFRKVGDTHFVSNHRVDDDEKEVKIHHLFYHVYSG